MTEPEKVIAILERCWKHECDKCDWRDGASGYPWSCPRRNHAEKAALELLKAQMPRVMTEDDVLHSTGKPMWFESRGMYLGRKGFWCLSFEVDPELHIRFVQSITGGKITLSLIDYGKVWRFWTSRPSAEMMASTPWKVKKMILLKRILRRASSRAMGHEPHITFSVRSDCWNMEAWAYGSCHRCGCCSKDRRERYESRLRLMEEHLDHFQNFDNWDDDPEDRVFQESNIRANIKWLKRRIKYYKNKIKAMNKEDV